MLILGIETSGLGGGIALCRDDACLGESALEELPRRHAQTLVVQIDQLLKSLSIGTADLDAVAVSTGPGSFTGVRIGVVCAKTLAYATGCRLAAVDTLEAIAANSPPDVGRVHVISDALRGDLFVAAYSRGPGGEWSREAPPAIVAATPWLAARRADEILSGPGLSVHGAAAPAACRMLPQEAWVPAARIVARIGARLVKSGNCADCEQLEPIYLRRSAAEERLGATQPPGPS